jgi:CubicO group peptidase (beta-lactamase class C family)
MSRLNRPGTGEHVCAPAVAKIIAFNVLLILVVSVSARAQSSGALIRSTPEQEGVSSSGVLKLVNAMNRSGMEFHSLMIVRHGRVVTEGWWSPYGPDLKHSMYSVSKSFTATAVGFAVSEKRMTVNDKVISFFPHDLPDTIGPNLAALSVKDLLTMSVGQAVDPTFSMRSRDTNWVKAFLALPIAYTPGTKFLYNSLASYMLSAIVQKVTGQKVIDYLTPRLFAPLHITGLDWEIDPRGINSGGWGLRIKTEDMAKFGQLFLQKGKWEGRQVLPKEWIEEATTMKILQSPEMPQAQRDSSDWQQGYCYQMWRCRYDAFRADGAFGQLIVILPKEDAVIVVTAEVSDMQAELNLIWTYALPALEKDALFADPADLTALRQKLASLSLPRPSAGLSANLSQNIDGKTYTLEPATKNLRSLSFAFDQKGCRVTFATDTATYPILFGAKAWAQGTTKRRGPDLIKAKGNSVGLPPFRTMGSCRWTDAHTLELTLRYIESPHTETITCSFNENAITVTMQNSLDRGKEKTILTGVLKKLE